MQVQTSPAEERGDTWHLRREKGTLASISLALRLTLNHGGEIHTHTHTQAVAMLQWGSKNMRGERE